MYSRKKVAKPTRPKSLAEAVALAFPDSHPDYQRMVVNRYLKFGVPEREAIKALGKGYSSPTAAMSDGLLKWRVPAELTP